MRRRASSHILLLLAAVFSSLWVRGGSTARANVAEDLGLGSRATALGGAFSAVADDFSAVFYNPAGLVQIRRSEITLEHLYASPTFHRTNDAAVVDFFTVHAVAGAGEERSFPPPTLDRGPAKGIVLGIAGDAGYVFGLKGAAFGLAAYLPYPSQITTPVVANSGEVPELVFYTDRLVSLMANVGVAYQLLPTLSLGAGANILADLAIDTYASVFIDPRTPEPLLNPRVEPVAYRKIVPDLAPHAGILWKPVEALGLGFTYRGKLAAEMEGLEEFPIFITVPSTGTSIRIITASVKPLRFVNFFSPESFTWGAALRPSERWTVSVDLSYLLWSATVDGQGHPPIPSFRDTLLPRLGLECRPVEGARLMAGYYFQPSPVPPQRGASNFMDLTKHVFSAGASYTLRNPTRWWRRRFSLFAYFQYHLMEDQVVEKDRSAEAGDGTRVGPDFAVSGSLFNVGGGVSLGF